MTALPPFTVVIVNYNGGQPILDCVAALTRQIDASHILIVDNASIDGSSGRIFERHPGVQILPFRRNVGFARAVNIAASRIEHDGAIVTLNPDTIPGPGFIESLVRPLVDDPRLGSTAATLVFASDLNVIASTGITIHRNGVAMDARLGELLHAGDSALTPIFGPSGGAAAYRLNAFRQLGGFCEPFFLYLEDVDLAWRMRLHGWDSVNVGQAVATHLYSASSVEGSPLKRRLLARNRIWTLARCLPVDIWNRDRVAILTHDLLATGHGTIKLDGASLKGRAAAVVGLPGRLRERRAIHTNVCVDSDELDQWIRPSISPKRLLELRRLTAKLAQSAPS